MYEQEHYNYQEFSFKDLNHHRYIGLDHKPSDFIMLRDGVKITCTPFAGLKKIKPRDSIVLRYMMMHQDGRLWAYNKPGLD